MKTLECQILWLGDISHSDTINHISIQLEHGLKVILPTKKNTNEKGGDCQPDQYETHTEVLILQQPKSNSLDVQNFKSSIN